MQKRLCARIWYGRWWHGAGSYATKPKMKTMGTTPARCVLRGPLFSLLSVFRTHPRLWFAEMLEWSSGAMWGDVGRCGAMWGDVGRCGAMWGNVGNVGRYLNRFGVLSKGFPLAPTFPSTIQRDFPTKMVCHSLACVCTHRPTIRSYDMVLRYGPTIRQHSCFVILLTD